MYFIIPAPVAAIHILVDIGHNSGVIKRRVKIHHFFFCSAAYFNTF